MAGRKPFLLRLEPEVLRAMQRWAADELRSLNGQIEYVLRNELKEEGRLGKKSPIPRPPPDGERP